MIQKGNIPNLFIVGAPKCGTTSMMHYLSQHPQIYTSPIKEPHYFNTDSEHRYYFDEKKYLSLFKDATEQHTYRCEGSVWYLYSKNAIDNILKFNPRAKFIVMLRNPVEMFFSLHEQLIFSGKENERSPEKAWLLQDDRLKGKNIPKIAINSELLIYKEICSLGKQSKRLLEKIPENKVRFILMDDFKQNPNIEYIKTLDFLDITKIKLNEYDVKNKRKTPRFPFLNTVFYYIRVLKKKLRISMGFGIANYIRKINAVEKKHVSFESEKQEFSSTLKNYFREDIQLLSKVVDKDLSHWYK